LYFIKKVSKTIEVVVMNKEASLLLEDIKQIRKQVVKDGEHILESWQGGEVREEYIQSLRNLPYYMAFRRYDRRELQNSLISWGVSSLGRLEPNVSGNLDAVIKTLGYITGDIPTDTEYFKYPASEGRNSPLANNTNILLGESKE